jgi:hypothetical protein
MSFRCLDGYDTEVADFLDEGEKNFGRAMVIPVGQGMGFRDTVSHWAGRGLG